MKSSPTESFADLKAAQVVVPQHVVHRAFPTETVILNLETGRYHGLNPTAGRMLEVLDETGAVRDAIARLCDEFDLSANVVEPDLAELCNGLIERGLLEVVSG